MKLSIAKHVSLKKKSSRLSIHHAVTKWSLYSSLTAIPDLTPNYLSLHGTFNHLLPQHTLAVMIVRNIIYAGNYRLRPSIFEDIQMAISDHYSSLRFATLKTLVMMRLTVSKWTKHHGMNIFDPAPTSSLLWWMALGSDSLIMAGLDGNALLWQA